MNGGEIYSGSEHASFTTLVLEIVRLQMIRYIRDHQNSNTKSLNIQQATVINNTRSMKCRMKLRIFNRVVVV